MLSLATPGDVGPPLSPTNLGMHGGAVVVTASWSCAPGAHFDVSPDKGRPSASTRPPAPFACRCGAAATAAGVPDDVAATFEGAPTAAADAGDTEPVAVTDSAGAPADEP